MNAFHQLGALSKPLGSELHYTRHALSLPRFDHRCGTERQQANHRADFEARRTAIGGLGYDLSFVRAIPTPTGRKIRFVTNRLLRFGETYYSTRTADYNLTGGEIDLNNQDKSKSTGILYPAAKLRLDKNNELSLDLNGNPWQLVNIIWGD
jgi:hypothetical protein